MHKVLSMFLTLILTAGGIATFASTAHASDDIPNTLNRMNWTWPTESIQISQYFSSGHDGIDIDGELGDDIYAAHSGRVIKADCKSAKYGCQVIVLHGKEKRMRVRYAHLDALAVEKKDKVTKGEVIGTMGSTGRSTGSHLHFEIKKLKGKKKTSAEFKDPLRFVEPAQ